MENRRLAGGVVACCRQSETSRIAPSGRVCARRWRRGATQQGLKPSQQLTAELGHGRIDDGHDGLPQLLIRASERIRLKIKIKVEIKGLLRHYPETRQRTQSALFKHLGQGRHLTPQGRNATQAGTL